MWTAPHVKAGGRYAMDEGHIVVDSISPIRLREVTDELARESGFLNVKDLLDTARHGRGRKVYLIRFHYLPAGAWDATRADTSTSSPAARSTQLLRRIRRGPSAPTLNET